MGSIVGNAYEGRYRKEMVRKFLWERAIRKQSALLARSWNVQNGEKEECRLEKAKTISRRFLVYHTEMDISISGETMWKEELWTKIFLILLKEKSSKFYIQFLENLPWFQDPFIWSVRLQPSQCCSGPTSCKSFSDFRLGDFYVLNF